MPAKLNGLHGEVDIPLSEDAKQNIFDKLSDYEEHQQWASHIKELTTAVRAHAKWQKLVTAMLEMLAFPKEKTWIMRLDTLMAACAFHALSYDAMTAAAHDKAFPPAEGEEPGQPDAEFVSAFSSCLDYAIKVAHPAAIPASIPCSKCKADNTSAAKFCLSCGIPINALAASPAQLLKAPDESSSATNGALQAIAHHLTEQTKLLQQIAQGSHDDDCYEELETEAKPTSIWNEKLLSMLEITQIREQHSYAMASYCQRAMVLMVEVYQRVYPYGDKEILQLISKAVRDMSMEYILPGSKPQQAEKLALASSLIGHRLPKEDLKKAIIKPKYQPSTSSTKPDPPPQSQQQQKGKPNKARLSQSQQTDP